MKICTKCGVPKDESEFRKHRRGCRACEKAYEKTRDPERVREIWRHSLKKRKQADPEEFKRAHNQAHRKWRGNNPEDAREANRKSHQKMKQDNPEEYRKKGRESSRKQRAKDPEKARARSRAQYRKDPKRANKPRAAQQKKKYNSDPAFKLIRLLRSRITDALAGKSKKSAKTTELLGCPWVWAEVHLESLFKPGMTWANHGPVWHIDHIKPCAKFDLTDPEQQKACFHWTNLQPLFAEENLKKSDHYVTPEPQTRLVI